MLKSGLTENWMSRNQRENEHMMENEDKKVNVAIIGGDGNARRILKTHLDLLQELEAYQAIGTVEELKVLKKKSEEGYKCPICNSWIGYKS